MKNKNQPKSLLVITPQYAPDFGPGAPIYTALCEDLQQMGCDVTVITAFPHYAGSGASFQHPKRLMEQDTINGVRIIRTYVYTVSKESLWRRLLYHASFNFFSTLALLKTKKPDIVFAEAPTLWSGLPLTISAILPGTPFTYIMHDIYPDVLSRLGVMKDQKILNLIENIEQYFYKRSAQISVLSNGFKTNLMQKGVPGDKISIIPVCVDVDFIRPISGQNELCHQWELEDKFVVLYAGNIGFSQGLETMLEAAHLLRGHPDIVFIIVGEGGMKTQLQERTARKELTNVKFYPFQPRECVPFVYDLADVCLILLKRDLVVESVPSKTYSIMSSGRPFIATVDRNTEVSALAEEAKCGICIEPENAEGLSKAIIKLYEDHTLCLEMGKRGRNFVVQKYSRRVAAEKYYELIERFV